MLKPRRRSGKKLSLIHIYMTVKHLADCLSVFKYVDVKEGARLIDVGTGAGFPGLVLLLARPDLDVTLSLIHI